MQREFEPAGNYLPRAFRNMAEQGATSQFDVMTLKLPIGHEEKYGVLVVKLPQWSDELDATLRMVAEVLLETGMSRVPAPDAGPSITRVIIQD